MSFCYLPTTAACIVYRFVFNFKNIFHFFISIGEAFAIHVNLAIFIFNHYVQNVLENFFFRFMSRNTSIYCKRLSYNHKCFSLWYTDPSLRLFFKTVLEKSNFWPWIELFLQYLFDRRSDALLSFFYILIRMGVVMILGSRWCYGLRVPQNSLQFIIFFPNLKSRFETVTKTLNECQNSSRNVHYWTYRVWNVGSYDQDYWLFGFKYLDFKAAHRKIKWFFLTSRFIVLPLTV